MANVRVIAPLGATIRGPALLRLSPEQFRRRSSVLVEGKRKGQFALPADAVAMFKHGEEFGIDGMDRLNAALFEDLDAAAKAEAEAKAKAEAEAGEDAIRAPVPPGGSGADTPPGGAG